MSPEPKLRILVADDEISFRMAASLVLRRSGLCEIDEAISGEDTIQALKAGSYDLIILDHQMGQVSGLNVLQWLHEQKIEVPVIVLTGLGSESIAVEMMKFGACDYFRKDQLDLSRLPSLVNTTIQSFRAKQEKAHFGPKPGVPSRRPDVVGMLEDTTASFSRSAQAVLGLISDEFEEYQKRIRPNLAPTAQSEVDRIMKNFHEQLKLVSLFTKTLSDLALMAQSRREQEMSPQSNRGMPGRDSDDEGGFETQFK